MSDVPKFSLVTIAYNDLTGLRRTVESVEAQVFGEFEHIIIDGGSTDGTIEYLQSLPARPKRTWLSERDRGIYDAMNKGISLGTGRLVMMLNSGDSLADPDSLHTIAESHDRSGWAWSYGAVRRVNPDGSHFGCYTFDPFNRRRFVMGLNWIPHATVTMDRELIDGIGVYRLDLGTAADQELLMRALSHSDPVVIPEFLCHYEVGGVSMRQSARSREIAWHTMRAENDMLIGGRAVDRLAAELLALGPPLRRALRRISGQAEVRTP